jgi:hypothetical protein
MWKIFSITQRTAKKKTAYRRKLTRKFIQPVIPAADTITFESASAITIAQRIPIKNIAHFLKVAESMPILGSRTIKISDKGLFASQK